MIRPDMSGPGQNWKAPGIAPTHGIILTFHVLDDHGGSKESSLTLYGKGASLPEANQTPN